jgi:hypothetical protein
VRLRVYFEQEFRPPDLPHDLRPKDSEAVIDFIPGSAGLRRFAAELDASLVRFPVRGQAPPTSANGPD